MHSEGPEYSQTLTGNTDAASDTPGGAGRDHDPVRLGGYIVRSPGGGRPLVMEFEARIATGKAGERLALEQAAAIREVLAWIASKREPGDDTHDRTGL